MKLITPKFRGSFVNVITPRRVKGDDKGEPKYSMAIVLPKDKSTTTKFIKQVKEAMIEAMKEKFGKTIPFEKCKHFPIADGDELTDDDGNQIEEFEGHYVLNAKNARQPGILVQDEDGARRPYDSESEIYSGAYYHASIGVYAWNHPTGGKGVSLSLNGVLKVADGERFGGSFDESDFDEVPAPRDRGEEGDESF